MAKDEPVLGQTDSATPPIIMVVANDSKLLKLLDMALSLELACEILIMNNGKSAEIVAQQIKPDLLILDERLLDRNTHELIAHLHTIGELEALPTLLINAHVLSLSESYPIVLLGTSWNMEKLYEAVHRLLGHTS